MAMNMNAFLLLADRDFSKIWHEEEPQLPPQYTQVFKADSFDGKLYKREAKMAGFAGLAEVADGQKISYQDAIAPVTKRFDFTTRGTGYRITRKLWENDEYGEVRKMERDLKRATDDDIEQYVFNIVNNATSTTNTGFDGLALASTAHTRLDGGAVQANRPTTLTALSLASVKDAIIAFKKLKDDRGRPYRSAPNKLLHAVDLEFTAKEILGSPDRPDTANRAVNSVRGVLEPMSSLYITSTTFWALMGPRHDLRYMWRNKPATDNKTDFETRNIHRIVFYDLGRGFSEWRDFYLGNT
jgi:hypothetical protein